MEEPLRVPFLELAGKDDIHLETMSHAPDDTHENDVGLEAGALFQHDGYVKISRLTHPNPQGSGGACAVGSVTVTIS